MGHRDRILGARDRGRAQHGIATELHRQRRVGCRADARVEDHRDAGALAARVAVLSDRFGAPGALLFNSDHLQAATALAAELLGLPRGTVNSRLRRGLDALKEQV